MVAARLAMRKIREILRLHFEAEHSDRAVGRSINASPSTVSGCLGRAMAAGLSWPLPEDLDDAALEALLYPPPGKLGPARTPPDWTTIHKELRRKGVTLDLLWQEYKAKHPDDGYQYSQFCSLYRSFKGQLDVVMRQDHRAGEKMFVDFSGDGIDIFDKVSGEVYEAQLFVAVLGASSYTYAEVFPSQDLHSWVMGHVGAYEFFEGVAQITVPDQPRTVVTRPCYYEPDLNPTYEEMGRHYGTAVIPARPRKPRDKAKVETAVLVSQRWILAALRNHTFFSIDQANDAVREKNEELNDREFKKLKTTRRKLFLSLDRPALNPLPMSRYEFAKWSRHRIGRDYHIEIDRHFYSVPSQLVDKKVEARTTATTVEALHRGRRVASHKRSFEEGGHTTCPEHMPASHRQYAEWTPARLVQWGTEVGPCCAKLVEKILEERPHPEQGYRSCLGLMRLCKSFGNDRLEAASRRALAIGSHNYRSVKSILENGLDREPLKTGPKRHQSNPVLHENIRGPEYYH